MINNISVGDINSVLKHHPTENKTTENPLIIDIKKLCSRISILRYSIDRYECHCEIDSSGKKSWIYIYENIQVAFFFGFIVHVFHILQSSTLNKDYLLL